MYDYTLQRRLFLTWNSLPSNTFHIWWPVIFISCWILTETLKTFISIQIIKWRMPWGGGFSRDPEFLTWGMRKLIQRWEKCIAVNGDYVEKNISLCGQLQKSFCFVVIDFTSFQPSLVCQLCHCGCRCLCLKWRVWANVQWSDRCFLHSKYQGRDLILSPHAISTLQSFSSVCF